MEERWGHYGGGGIGRREGGSNPEKWGPTRCQRVLVFLRIEHWFACVRHGPVAISFCCPLFRFVQVMSQLRRSARSASLRARGAKSSSVPEPIPDSLCSSPRDSPDCIECGFELESEDNARVFICCSSLRHLRCLAPLAVAVGQEVRCPDCPSEFADHVSADCFINGVEWSCTSQLSDCTVCMEAMTENSIQVPCCGQFVRVFLSYTPEPHIAFCPIFVHPLFPVFELHIQQWVICPSSPLCL